MWRVHSDETVEVTMSESCQRDVQWQAGNAAAVLSVCAVFTDLQPAPVRGRGRFSLPLGF